MCFLEQLRNPPMQLPNPRSHQHQKQRNQTNPSGTLTLTLGPRSQHQLLKVHLKFFDTLPKNPSISKSNSHHWWWMLWSHFLLVVGKGRGRKRKGSGSEEDYNPVKKVAKPASRVSTSVCIYQMHCCVKCMHCNLEHQWWESNLIWSKIAIKKCMILQFAFIILNICMSIKLLYTQFYCHIRKSEKLFGLGLFYVSMNLKAVSASLVSTAVISTTMKSSLWTGIQVYGYE